MPENDAFPPPQYHRGEFIMPGGTPVSEAAMQFFVEAMRANTNVLQSVGETMKGLQAEQREQLKMVTDVRERVIKMESIPRTDRELAEIRGRLHTLEQIPKLEGAIATVAERLRLMELHDAKKASRGDTWTWIARYMPGIASLFVVVVVAIIILAFATGKLDQRAGQVQTTVSGPAQ